ncbi:Uncharacterised protein [Campylobacter devanensis]|uniref:Uncharacterized protein n=1 Tax=Campylobacter devanensis TaxID=3161138 RepID=A0A1X9STT6_9BACT|nr:hypothetical protein [Campylobacter lanienae]ARQ99667.1 hypothetical protein CIGN_1423 [Campylobacter lanienae]SUX02911.1 Uncharacterised protein [Campylobacter lanienae]
MSNLDKFQNNGGIVLLDTKQLKTLLHIKGDATLWRYLKDGIIPQPRLIVSRSKRLWALDEVLSYLSKNKGGEI